VDIFGIVAMSLNAQIIDDLRYLADNSSPENRAMMHEHLRVFASLLIDAGCMPLSCPPLGVNEGVRSVTVPASSDPRAGIPNAAFSKPSSMPPLSEQPKKRSSANFDLFPELLPPSGCASPKKRQNGLSAHALVALSLCQVGGNGSCVTAP
jgi:hypothetical protein